MNVLHTEASLGWGGQEIRILEESLGMQERGHKIFIAAPLESALFKEASKRGLRTFALSFTKPKALFSLLKLIWIMLRHRIHIVNTHSSLDAWIGGFAARIACKALLRTRHLSTPIRKGLNSKILYNYLADIVVTTSQEALHTIRHQAKLPPSRSCSIPTGINPSTLHSEASHSAALRQKYGIKEGECVAGTLCVLRGWKGVSDILHAAHLLRDEPLKWLIVGSGVSEGHFKGEWKALRLEEKVIFTGYLSPPNIALAAMDIFLLVSWANEGVSQAALQASFLEKPLITTTVGGLPEICLPNVTGLLTCPHSPEEIAACVRTLLHNPHLRQRMGEAGKKHVESRFTRLHMLDAMEKVYKQLFDISGKW